MKKEIVKGDGKGLKKRLLSPFFDGGGEDYVFIGFIGKRDAA